MGKKSVFRGAMVFAVIAFCAACSSSSGYGSPTGSTSSDVIGGCSTFVDNTATPEVSLAWGLAITSDPNHCSKIKVGSKVKWVGDFDTHPLAPKDGDTPNPITSDVANNGGFAEITFPAAGTFGYTCEVHAQMIGAIQVVP